MYMYIYININAYHNAKSSLIDASRQRNYE